MDFASREYCLKKNVIVWVLCLCERECEICFVWPVIRSSDRISFRMLLSMIRYFSPSDIEFFGRWDPPEWLTAHPDYTGLDIFKQRLLSKYTTKIKIKKDQHTVWCVIVAEQKSFFFAVVWFFLGMTTMSKAGESAWTSNPVTRWTGANSKNPPLKFLVHFPPKVVAKMRNLQKTKEQYCFSCIL